MPKMKQTTRPLPVNEQAERRLVAALLVTPDLLPDVRDRLSASDFSLPVCAKLYQAAVKCLDERLPIEELTVAEAAGVPCSEVAMLCDGVPPLRCDTELEIVLQTSLQRLWLRLSDDANSAVYGDYDGAVKAMSDFACHAGMMSERALFLGGQHFADPARTHGDYYLRKTAESNEPTRRLPLPQWPLLNYKFGGGLRSGWVYTVGARPGGGKTSFMIDLAIKLVKVGLPGLVIEIENSLPDTLDKLYSNACGLDFEILSGERFKADAAISSNLLDAGELFAKHLHLECGPRRIRDITKLVYSYKSQYGIKWFAIDYLQNVTREARADRFEAIQENMQTLARVTKTLGLAGVILSQASRDVESERQNRIKMRHFFGSSYIEAESDCVLAIQHAPDENPDDETITVEIDLLKNRWGRGGFVPMRFQKPIGRFCEVMK